jgi:hypothetical protein
VRKDISLEALSMRIINQTERSSENMGSHKEYYKKERTNTFCGIS